MGWKCGCQPFSCPCSQHVTHCPKEICSTCFSKESIPAIPLGNAKHLLPTRSRFLRATVRSTSSAFCLHHAHPFVAAEEKKQSRAEKQRVWSPSLICYCYNAVFVLSVVTMQFLFVVSKAACRGILRSRPHVTKATKAMNNCRDSASGQGWTRGCQPFSCRCSLNVMHCRKEIYGTCLSKESMPFVKSKPPLPTVPEA